MKKTTLLLAHLLTRHDCLWAALGLLATLAFGPLPARAAVTEAWVHRYSNVVSNSNDQAVKVVVDAAGDIIVTGNTDDRIHGQDMLTIKYSGADGSVLWQQRYNGPANSDDRAKATAVDASGNVVVTGDSTGTNGYYDYYTAKYAAADGALLWEKRYDGPVHNHDEVEAMAVDATGNVVVTGSSQGDYYTAKYAAADGRLLWEKRYNGPGNDYDVAQAVAVDGSGNVVVTGSSFSGAPNYKYTYYTAKYAAADGVLLWEKRSTGLGGYDLARAVAVDGSGNVVVTGDCYTGDSQAGYYSGYYTAKYAAANGALLWQRRYHGPTRYNDEARALAVDGSGNVVVTGYSWGNDGENYYTAKYAAANGALLWEKRALGGRAVGMAVDGSGNVVVSGSGDDYYTAKYAGADGTLLWEKRYNGPSNGYDAAQAVAVDGTGNVVVTGFSSKGGGYYDNDYYTAKYAVTDGALLWEKRYNGPANGDDIANAVTVDGTGNVVVTGESVGDGSDYDYYTAKYAAANGALLWEQRYNGPANLYDYARALAVDGTGNVVVTGWSCGANGYSDYYTAKYAAADGTLLWEKRYNGPANSYDIANALAVDGSGNVVVTGDSSNGNNTDYYTAKYAATDGALLWEKRYNGPANSDDRANAVAVDGSGNVVVTGYSQGAYYTAKYAAADGALLWEKRYNGPANMRDQAQAVAVDASGNVVVTGISDAIFDCYDCDWLGDFYTAKYSGADGALLWEKRYGRAYGFDYAYALTVDGGGNVVVGGLTDSSWEYNGGDYYTAKYAAVDGALLWEKRYNGAANGYDYASRLALGPNGMVAVTGSSGRDYATVLYRDDVYPISIELVPGGVRLRFIGIPGRSYTIERAPTVTGPWRTVAMPTAPASGLLEYLDASPSPGSAFYRTVQP